MLAVSGMLAVPASIVSAQRVADGVGPRYEVDASWPKPLPNRWVMGQASGVAVDARDNVWVVHRPRTVAERDNGAALPPARSACCPAAPPVMQFDGDGNLLQAWGGPGNGYEWPTSEHGIHVDAGGHVWLGGNGEHDHQVLKFTPHGKFVLQIGRAYTTGGDADTAHLGRPAAMHVDVPASEVYVADGYANHRVIVFDATTGAYKRHWGADGRPPGEPGVKRFATPVHCVRMSRDGLLYVCDRRNNRVQVFRKDGTFVKELLVAPATRGGGSVWDVDFSHDALQIHLYAADGQNNTVWALLRESGRVLTRFGRSGRGPGQFHWVHNIAVDSRGNIYTTEVDDARRAQKFAYRSGGAAAR
jgi:DNA-binding beta-propeller fold protein YncE